MKTSDVKHTLSIHCKAYIETKRGIPQNFKTSLFQALLSRALCVQK